jgi:serine protease Do
MQNAKCKLQASFILHFAICILHFAIALPVSAQADTSLAVQEESALRAAADRVAESVVQIRTIGGLDSVGRTTLADGPTTGLIVSADGYIVSSAFNFVHEPASILVTLSTGKQLPAELVATDHSCMIVMLKVAGASELPVPEFVPSEEISVGQWAVAVGRTYRPDRTNVSVGIVSAVNRMFGRVLQTDADVSLANYGGPLVDIRGRVLGVIVPIAPQGASEVAGAEWYGSGIGFAVPIGSLTKRLEQLKQGKDLRAGILGIGMRPGNPHSAPARLAAVRPDSPAGRAGFKRGDRIVEIDGTPIRTQTDLRFALGTRYGGDSVRAVVERGDERIERTVILASELPAFRHAFLGVLPMREESDTSSSSNSQGDDADDDEGSGRDSPDKPAADAPAEANQGITVRMVFPGSPAEAAGVQAGDRITQINGTPVDSIGPAIDEMNNLAPESEASLQVLRGEQEIELTLSTARLSANVPDELPPAQEPTEPSADDRDQNAAKSGETRELKLPEFPQQCKVYVPLSVAAGRPAGLLLWIHPPGEADADSVIGDWREICDRDGLVLVVPTAAEASRWERTELEYLGRLTKHALSEFEIDPRRVVVYGERGGGAMAWLLGLAGREVFRGVATSAAPLPRQIRVPANEPGQRLAIFAGVPNADEGAVLFAQGLQKCTDAGYSVATLALTNAAGNLSSSDREELARWIDTLDRF